MSNKSPFTIVVGVDFEADGELALDEAIRVAGRDPEAELHVLYVERELASSAVAGAEISGVSHVTTRTQSALDKLEALCTERIEAAQRANPRLRFRRAVTHFRIGQPADEIVQLAVDLNADLIVVGTHNRKGLRRFLLGSVAERVAHGARCTVQIVRAKDHDNVGEVPEIEPPCPRCVEARAASSGAELWCEQHKLAKYHPRAHRYSYSWGPAPTLTPTDTMGGPTVQ